MRWIILLQWFEKKQTNCIVWCILNYFFLLNIFFIGMLRIKYQWSISIQLIERYCFAIQKVQNKKIGGNCFIETNRSKKGIKINDVDVNCNRNCIANKRINWHFKINKIRKKNEQNEQKLNILEWTEWLSSD